MKPQGMIAWFAHNPVAANFLMISILVLGAYSATNLRKEDFPQLPPNTVTVTVPYEGSSVQDSHDSIALKIEEALQSVTGIKQTISTSTRSGVEIRIEKQQGVDLTRLLSDVKVELDAISNFPRRAERLVVRAQLDEEDAVWMQIYGDVEQQVLQQLAEEIRLDLLKDPAVNKASLVGKRALEVAIELNESQLQSYDLSLANVSEVISQESFSEIGAQLESTRSILQVSADSRRYSEQDFADIVLKTYSNGHQLRLGDVATVRSGISSSPKTLLRFDGHPAVAIQVLLGSRDDVVTAVAATRATFEHWQGRLPEGVSLAVWKDESDEITGRLGTMGWNGLMGMLLVMALLSLFLHIRIAFWVAVGLPVCFMGATLMMSDGLLGMSLNEISSFGFIVAMGIVVDDAIIVGENIYRHKLTEQGDVVAAVQEVAVPTVFGVLTTIAAFASLGLVDGMFGKIFSQFALIVAICLLFSILESKLILPAHLAPLNLDAEGNNSWLEKLRRKADSRFSRLRDEWYRPTLQKVLSKPGRVLVSFVLIWCLSLMLVQQEVVRTMFFPDIAGDEMSVHVSLHQDAGFGMNEAVLGKIERSVQSLNSSYLEDGSCTPIQHIQVHMTDAQSGNVEMQLNECGRAEEVAQYLREQIGQPEAVRSLVYTADDDGPEPIVIEMISPDAASLDAAGQRLVAALQGFPGVRDINHDLQSATPEIQLTLTPEGRALGLDGQSLAEQLQQAFYGYETQRIQIGRDEVKVRVRYPEESRQNLADLWNMKVRTPKGAILPLGLVASPRLTYPQQQMVRVDSMPAVILNADVDEDITSSDAVLEALERDVFVELQQDFPGLTFGLGGESREKGEIMNSFVRVALFAMFTIYALIAIPLKSYWQPILIMSVIPFGLTGAIFGHLVHGLPISLLSIFGLLALCGVVVNDSLLLVSRFNIRRTEFADETAALVGVAGDRLRAILLTSVTTFVGLVPLMLNQSEQGQYLKPAAASLAYGILFATMITLFVIPILIQMSVNMRRNFPKMLPAASTS